MDVRKNRLWLLGLMVAMSACSTTLELSSNPSGADVVVKPIGSGAEKKLGQTPLTLRPSDLDGIPSGGGPLRFRLSKDGYKPIDVVVTDSGAADLKVHTDLEAGPGFDNPARLNSHLEQIFTAQQLIQIKKFDEAQKLLESTRLQVPTLAVVHELLGGIYFIRGEKVLALDSFKRALALNPNSVDALNMSAELGRGTASETPTGAAVAPGGQTP